MTKHCLRLLFLAAAALSLVHGCGDGSLECLGTAVACSSREESECAYGCHVESGCIGDAPVTCASLTDNPTLCRQTPGCDYLGTCDGEEGCRRYGYDECAEHAECNQVRRCDGAGVACGNLEQSQCELYPQCRLGSRCEGTATRCSSLDSASACQQVPGCYPADTEPSVVSGS